MEVKKSGDIFKMFVCKRDQRNRVVAREECAQGKFATYDGAY